MFKISKNGNNSDKITLTWEGIVSLITLIGMIVSFAVWVRVDTDANAKALDCIKNDKLDKNTYYNDKQMHDLRDSIYHNETMKEIKKIHKALHIDNE